MSETLAPHFVQIGDTPAFTGSSARNLVCACGESVLVRGYHPTALIGIAIECAKCGAVTTTPDLPPDASPPANVKLIPREKMPVPTSIVLPDGYAVADREMMLARDARTQPRKPSPAPMVLSRATADALCVAYDRISGGQLEADRAAMARDRVDVSARLPALPLAWAFEQLEPSLDQSGWWCLAQDADTVAAIQLGAFREFLEVWSHHPLFDAMAASVAAGGFSTHAIAVFAAAQSLVAAGNRVGFDPPPPGQPVIDTFHIDNNKTDRLQVVVRRFDRFDWPAGQTPDAAAVRAAAIDALIASQARINVRHPGILVLSVGSVLRQMDPVIITTLAQTMAERWRKHRGLVGVALVLPKVYATNRSDEVTFGWTFLPDANPRYAGNMVQSGPPPGPDGPALLH